MIEGLSCYRLTLDSHTALDAAALSRVDSLVAARGEILEGGKAPFSQLPRGRPVKSFKSSRSLLSQVQALRRKSE